jgi:hypothetical protein
LGKEVGMAVAISGATIVREWEGAYTKTVKYKQRCDVCGYIPLKPPISVQCLPYQTGMHGCYHEESFVCGFCGNRQLVKIEG